MHVDQPYESDKERYKRQRNEWKHRCNELEVVNTTNLSIIEELSHNLAKEQERVDRTKRSANLLETAMDNKEVFLGTQARNDDEVRGKFGSILSSIKTWSNNFNAGSGHTFREDMLPEYQRVAPLCTKLQTLEQTVTDKKRKRLFVRGWAAYVMTKSLFRTLDPLGDLGKDIWLDGGVGDTFSRLENELWFSGMSKCIVARCSRLRIECLQSQIVNLSLNAPSTTGEHSRLTFSANRSLIRRGRTRTHAKLY